MTTTTTTAKPKAPKTERTIVSMKLTAGGVKTVLAASAESQLQNALDLCRKLATVPVYKEGAEKAMDGLVMTLTANAK